MYRYIWVIICYNEYGYNGYNHTLYSSTKNIKFTKINFIQYSKPKKKKYIFAFVIQI